MKKQMLSMILVFALVCLLLPRAAMPAIAAGGCRGEGLTEAEQPDGLPSIDFKDLADADKFQIIGQESSLQTEGVGVNMVSTRQGIEHAGFYFEDGHEMLQGEDANTPVDIVRVPVGGDWTATLHFTFDPGSSRGYYEFFGFYAMQGADWQNLAGIRGSDGDIQDFLRQDGQITSAYNSWADYYLTSSAEHWWRIEKTGDSYICSGSIDGETFDLFFVLSGTGIEANYLMIDAYTGMSEGYTYVLKELAFEGGEIPVEPVNPFVDVKEGKYFYEPVLWAVYHDPQITNGTDDTHFSPNKICTRGQVVTFLWRAYGCPEPGITEHSFMDVKAGAYYYQAMLWAVECGITAGTSETTFGPNKECTRAQAVTFLWRAAEEPEPESDECPFTDVKPTASYRNAVLWAVENGITNGTSATTFSPTKTCTRGQVVTFLYNAMEG